MQIERRKLWQCLLLLAGSGPALAQTGPQAAVPAPLPPGSDADTPGGSARNGVIAPPPTGGDPGINRGAPGAGAFGTPVIRPPGTGPAPTVIPK